MNQMFIDMQAYTQYLLNDHNHGQSTAKDAMYLTPHKMESLSSTIGRSGKMHLIHLSIFLSACILTMCRNLNKISSLIRIVCMT